RHAVSGYRDDDCGGCSIVASRMEARPQISDRHHLPGRLHAFVFSENVPDPGARIRRAGRTGLASAGAGMNMLLLYPLLLKATMTSFSALTSLPVVRNDFVVHRQVLTDRQLNAAVVAGRSVPGPNGLYVVSVGYFISGVPGACAGWLAVVTPAFVMIP